MNHPIGGSGSERSASTLDGRVRVRRAIEAGNPGRDKMRDKNHHKHEPSAISLNTRAAPPVYAAEERKTVHQGLRILARIIARAHL